MIKQIVNVYIIDNLGKYPHNKNEPTLNKSWSKDKSIACIFKYKEDKIFIAKNELIMCKIEKS